MATKNTFLIARVKPEEKEEFVKAAKEANVSEGELLRSLARAYVEGKQIRQ